MWSTDNRPFTSEKTNRTLLKIKYRCKKRRVNFRFAPYGLVTLTVLLQTFKNSHFTP
ncbi:hypothetical protein Hanom_Chr03g00267341 [Helianthus anomalus]